MIVSEFMHKPTAFISDTAPLRKAMKLMLSMGVNGLAVKNKASKLSGYLTEVSVLSHLYPTQQEFMDRSAHMDFEEMENNMSDLLKRRVKDVMKTDLESYSLSPESSVFHALTIMQTRQLSHLPVVNRSGAIIGEVSQNDIFNALLGKEGPQDVGQVSQDYHDWAAQLYDLVHPWKVRFEPEVKSIISMLRKNKVNKVLDIGFGSGTHAIELARLGYDVVGLEQNLQPYLIAMRKKSALTPEQQNRIEFIHTQNYIPLLGKMQGSFDAVLILGNILPHYETTWKKILKAAVGVLSPKGTIVVQLHNFKKILQTESGLFTSIISPSKLTDKREYAYTLFYDKPEKVPNKYQMTMSVLRFDGIRWTHEAINSTYLADVQDREMSSLLKTYGLSNINVHGSNDGEGLFESEFSVKKHDWFTISGRL